MAGGATNSNCGNFLVSETGAFYKRAVLFENKVDKRSDSQICGIPIWGKYGATPSKASKEIQKFIKEKEKFNLKITKDMKIKRCSFPVSSLFCEQDAHREKGEYISHAYSVIVKRNITKEDHRNNYKIIQKDSVNHNNTYKYVENLQRKINTNNVKMIGADDKNVERSQNAECLEQAYADCARAVDGLW